MIEKLNNDQLLSRLPARTHPSFAEAREAMADMAPLELIWHLEIKSARIYLSANLETKESLTSSVLASVAVVVEDGGLYAAVIAFYDRLLRSYEENSETAFIVNATGGPERRTYFRTADGKWHRVGAPLGGMVRRVSEPPEAAAPEPPPAERVSRYHPEVVGWPVVVVRIFPVVGDTVCDHKDEEWVVADVSAGNVNLVRAGTTGFDQVGAQLRSSCSGDGLFWLEDSRERDGYALEVLTPAEPPGRRRWKVVGWNRDKGAVLVPMSSEAVFSTYVRSIPGNLP